MLDMVGIARGEQRISQHIEEEEGEEGEDEEESCYDGGFELQHDPVASCSQPAEP